ncbi:MAG: signal peptidase II [Parachlamydiales bacterium]|nr:signal peptidase II [Parachlamydiales bacterium]
MKKWAKYLAISVILLVFDCSLKYFTYTAIPKTSWIHMSYPFGGIGIFHNIFNMSFSLNHVENSGAAWGLFAEYTNYLIFLRGVIICGLIGYLLFFNKEKHKTFFYLLIITGAVGNLLDFFFYGKVIDMFHFTWANHSFPVFNMADCMISLGIFFLVIMPMLPKKWKQKTT